MDVDPEVFRFSLGDELTMSIRLLIALVAGGIVGYERGAAGKRVGVRTMMLVAGGSVIFTLVSLYGFTGQDPSRVAAQVASGVGFLGAGAILHEGATVKGLTTAASIWVAAALGLAAGTGMYAIALLGAVFAAIAMAALPDDWPHEDSD